MGIMKVGVRCQQCGGRISMGRLLEICPGCGAQGNHAYAVRQRHLQKRPHLKRGHQVSLFAIVTFFALVVVASRMGSFMSNNQVVKKERLPEVVQRIGSASGYVRSRKNGITSTETTLIKHAEEALKEALDKTNTFFKNEWKSYQSKMEQLNLSPFKEVKSFKID